MFNWQGEFSEIINLKNIQTDLNKKQTRWSEQEQKLSIGIMGQVKAGKSSFLNALLFAGKPILPEAATPKTANLTRVGYGETFKLTVEYYSRQEWDEIETIAATEVESVEAKVAKELVAMVKELSLSEIDRCLSQTKEVITAENLDGLQGILNQFTGNNGSHTPLVKCTEITLPIESLKGFEVVDTPGMNDPVASRTQKTREYMANCDVVFFLSRCSQFLDKADDDLLRDQLPNKGIKRLVLVAGQFDSVILDDGYDRASLEETEQNITQRLTRHAKAKAEAISKFKVGLNDTQHQMVIESLSNPVFASTFAYGFASWDKASWSDAMQHVHSELSDLAEDEWDYEFTQEDWLRIGNFDTLQQAFDQAKADRQVLLDEQKRSILPDAYNAMLKQFTSLEGSINHRIDFIQSKDVADIEKEQQAYKRRADLIGSSLAYTLAQARNNAKQQAAELIVQLKQDQISFSQLATRKGSKTEEYSYQISDSTWYKPWSWGSSHTVYSTRSVSYDYVNAHDAIEQVNQFGADSAQQIVAIFSKIISPDALKLSLKKALLNELDTKSADFDPTLFKAMLENFVSKIDLPIFDIELGDTTRLIATNFQGEVTDANQMEQLRGQLGQSLTAVLSKLQTEFESQFEQVMAQLESAGKGLSTLLTADIHQALEKVKLQIADKVNEIVRHQELLAEVGVAKLDINQKLTGL
jgi:predicted GTPase